MTWCRLLLVTGSSLGLGWQAVAVPPASPPASAVAAESVLQRLLTAERGLVYRGELDTNGESRMMVTRGPDRRLRQDWLSPPEMAGDLVIDNGAMRWHYSPRRANADASPSEQTPLSPAARQALIQRNYQLSVQPGRPIANEPTQMLVLTPRVPHLVEHRLYVSDRGLALRTERWRGRQMLDYAAFTTIDWRPTLERDTFAPSLPPGAKVKPTIHVLASGQRVQDVAGRLNFRPKAPETLPSGFQATAVRVFTSNGSTSPIAHWQLTDGMSSVSLFARKASAWRLPADSRPVALPNGIQGAILEHGVSTMLIWQVGGVRYTLVGAIAPEALVATAAATVRAHAVPVRSGS